MGRSNVCSSLLRLRVQLDRRAVYAVAQAGRLRAVVKAVAQVPAAVRARDLGPDHEVRVVHRLLDRRALRRGVEARPAAVGVELRLRLEQLGPATRAQIRARGLRVPVLAREGALGSLLAQHVELRGGEVALPIRLALLHSHLLHRPYSAIFRAAPNYLQVDRHVDSRLKKEAVVWLVTAGRDRRPQAVPVWFLWDGRSFLIYAAAQPGTKVRHIRSNPYVELHTNTDE